MNLRPIPDGMNAPRICRNCVYFAAVPSVKTESERCGFYNTLKFSTDTCDNFHPFMLSSIVRIDGEDGGTLVTV